MKVKFKTADLDGVTRTREEFSSAAGQPRVCLIVPWISERRAVVKNISRGFEQLSIQYLAAYLKNYGVRCDLINAQLLEWTDRDIANALQVKEYDLVGISCPAQRLYPAVKGLLRLLEDLPYRPHVTIGGWFATVAHREIMEQCRRVDSIVRGEGEFTLVELLCNLQGSFDGVAGITWRQDGKIVINPDRPRINDLDILPFPDRSDLVKIFDNFPKSEYYVHLMASRGCYADCSFCSINSLFSARGRSLRSPDNVCAEIAELHEQQGVSHFQFIDEIFLDRSRRATRWVLEFCDRVARLGYPIRFFIYCRSIDVSVEVFSRLKEVGLHMVYIGAESGSQAGLDRFNKDLTVDDNTSGISILKDLGVDVQLGFIMIDPASTFSELASNYRWLVSTGMYVQNNFTNKLNLYFKTPIAQTYKVLGLIGDVDIAERHAYKFADSRVEAYSHAVENLGRLMFPLEEVFHQAKLVHRRSAVSPTVKTGVAGDIARLAAPLMNELWREIAGELVGALEHFAGIETIIERFATRAQRYTEIVRNAEKDPDRYQAWKREIHYLISRSSSHYINECLPS
jgi:radical SAM superfamily enzyme YgiQ (UPF0313 family)